MVADAQYLERLERAVLYGRELVRRQAENPVRYVRWLPLQYRFMLSPLLVKLIRAGNQGLGKSTACLAEVVGHCIGRHPLGREVPPPPVEWWILCASKRQSVAVQKKLWALLPKDELLLGRGGTRFTPAAGFSPVEDPRVLFKNGSIIRFRATSQEGLDLTAATLDGALFDEPPSSERIYTEVLQRLEERGGTLLLGFTPVNADVGYIRELVASGAIVDFHARLEPHELVPVGHDQPLRTADGRVKDARYIAAREAKVSAYEREVVIHGGWEFRAQGAWFNGAWDPGRMVYLAVPELHDKLVLGVDHGDRPGKQVAVLMAVNDRGTDGPVVHVLDLYRDELGIASPRVDAEGILHMLGRHGISWDQLFFAGGDRVHMQGTAKQKSNRDLAAQLCKQLGLESLDKLRPPVRTVKRGSGRGAGSLRFGSRWLFHAMVEGRFSVGPAAAFLIQALPKYDLTDDDKGYKDAVDAVRYGLDRWIFAPWARRSSGGGSTAGA
jgi:hypothetical protein